MVACDIFNHDDSDKDLKACVTCDIPFVPINYSGRLLKIENTTFEEIYG